MAASYDGDAVIIWEWKNDASYWIPYEPCISNFLEEHKDCKECFEIGNINPAMSRWTVNCVKMRQSNSVTGGWRPVRRRIYSSDCPLADGIAWQWMDSDSSWLIYDSDSAMALENAYQASQKEVDLAKPDGSVDYLVNLETMVQIKKTSACSRHIRRYSDLGRYCTYSTSAGDNTADDEDHSASNCNGNAATSSDKSALVKSADRSLLKKLKFSKDFFGVKNKSKLKVSQSLDSKLSNQVNSSQPASPVPPVTLNVRRSRSFISPVMSGVTSLLLSPITPSYQSLSYQPHPYQPLAPSVDVTGNCMPAVAPKPEAKDKAKTGKRKKFLRSSKSGKLKDMSASAVVDEYSEEVDGSTLDGECNICFEMVRAISGFSADPSVGRVVCRLAKCQHVFHKACLHAMYDSGHKDGSLQCPSCKMIYGEKYGNCPAGRMEMGIIRASLPGYSCDTIRIVYSIPPGIQGANHPNPGRPYTARGFPRLCYLPNDKQGRQVMSLLKLAWERRLTFTIGTSATTGEDNTVTWNEIHHKTEFGSNYSGHGYPDDRYLDNVIQELAAQGITPDLLG